MVKTQTTNVSPKAIKDASKMWDNFLFVSKICGIATAVVLIIMALTLV